MTLLRLIAVILILLPLPVLAQSSPAGIAVNGQAEIMVVPDQVVFKVKVDNTKLDLSEARKETEADVKKVFELTRKYGIAPQNVQTYYISVDEHYEKVNEKSVFTGYDVSQTIMILLPDISRFESIFAGLLTMSVTDVSDVDFRVSNTRKYMDQARALALKAAREKAVAMANELGQKVGKAIYIVEVGSEISSAYETESSSSYASNYSSSVADGVPDNKSSVAPGMMSISARIKVTFELN
jgi:uncharacterized protein YggE